MLGHFQLPASEARLWMSDWDGEEPGTRGGAGPGASATLSMSMLSPESPGDHTVLGTAPVMTASRGGETRSPPTGLSHVYLEDFPLDQLSLSLWVQISDWQKACGDLRGSSCPPGVWAASLRAVPSLCQQPLPVVPAPFRYTPGVYTSWG